MTITNNTFEMLQIYDATGKLLQYEFDTNSTKYYLSGASLELSFGDEERRLVGGGFSEVYKMKGVIKTSKQDMLSEIKLL